MMSNGDRGVERDVAEAGTSRRRVLIIDDDDEIRGMLAHVVSSSGYAPIEAGGGMAGLELAAAVAPDAVCLDLCMDDMSGLDVLDHLHYLWPELPVIIITASACAGSRRAPRR